MLTTEERIEIVILCIREGFTQIDDTAEYNGRHPDQQSNPATHSSVD